MGEGERKERRNGMRKEGKEGKREGRKGSCFQRTFKTGVRQNKTLKHSSTDLHNKLISNKKVSKTNIFVRFGHSLYPI